MSASASPNPTNLLLLAGLGIGAYWFMTRQARAQSPTAAQIPNAGVANPYRGVVPDLVNAVTGLFRGGAVPTVPGTYDGRSATPWDVTPAGPTGPRFNNPSAYVSSAVDGLAFNPPAQAAFDFAANEANWAGDAGGWLGF